MEQTFQTVQEQIGYRFRNPELLRQAFTRRSYAQEHGGEDNEILELIGDKALDLVVLRLLISTFSKDPTQREAKRPEDLIRTGRADRAFACSKSEGELTRLKSRMVQSRTLARRIDELGFSAYLIMGKGDEKRRVNEELSVKEDLFEAIIGAVTLDSGWDLLKIRPVVEVMLCPDDFLLQDGDDNYVRLVQEWSQRKYGDVPQFRFFRAASGFPPAEDDWSRPHQPDLASVLSFSSSRFRCELTLPGTNTAFQGYGGSKNDARRNAAKNAYAYLQKSGQITVNGIRDEIDKPNRENAIGQLETLARRGYFPIPEYAFSEKHTENGDPVWTCTCRIDTVKKNFRATSSAKKSAKKDAAFQMLLYVLKEEY